MRRDAVGHDAIIPDINHIAGAELAGSDGIYNYILSCVKVNHQQVVQMYLDYDGLHEHAFTSDHTSEYVARRREGTAEAAGKKENRPVTGAAVAQGVASPTEPSPFSSW